jgi:site-specific recombinase XerD
LLNKVPPPTTVSVVRALSSRDQLMAAFAEFLRLDVASGDASPDTLRTYRRQVAAWTAWCCEASVHPASATVADVKRYRRDLIDRGLASATIALRLAVLSRLYGAAKVAGLRADNPAAGVRPPRDKRPVDRFLCLTEVELALLFRAVPKDGRLKHLRDRAVLGLMGLQGLRTVEIARANVSDLREQADGASLLVRGKGRDRVAYLRDDVSQAIRSYLSARRATPPDADGLPLFLSASNSTQGHRLSRRGVRMLVDSYLEKIDAKRPGLSAHGLRHTAATLSYRYTRDIRAVQDLLGHASPTTTSRYAHVVDASKNNPARRVPVKL